MPPVGTKEPAILTSWAAKSPSLGSPSHFSPALHDSVTGRHQPVKSPLSASSFPRETKLLSKEEVLLMYAGAPCFGVTEHPLHPQPTVTFKSSGRASCDNAKDTADLTHSTFEDASFEPCTRTDVEDGSDEKPSSVHADVILEVPAMSGLAGYEPGTVGHSYFLQLPISDSILAATPDESTSTRIDLTIAPEKLGLRSLNLEYMIDRLSELSEHYRAINRSLSKTTPNEQKVAEWHTELFSRLLISPEDNDITTGNDSRGLEVQIEALLKTLSISGLGHDFNFVEWRIRLGQLLWNRPEDQYDTSVDEGDVILARNVVLLQITLASELLVRIEMSDRDVQMRGLSKKIQWDLILARRFLENVCIAQKSTDDMTKKENRVSVMSALSFFTANESQEETQVEPVLYPRHEKRQLDGLLKFAEALKWPHKTDIEKRFNDRLNQKSLLAPGPTPTPVPTIGAYTTPVSTPDASSAMRNSYFGATPRPQLGRSATAQSVKLLAASAYGSETLDAGGWLSRSWLTGLVLPGEAASHFLISTLLENSPRAIETLGDSANLYGGFVYAGRSYWSKSCIVGRVLAAQEGAGECMGWISSSCVPVASKDGWVDIDAKQKVGDKESRILTPGLVAKDSAFVRHRGISADAKVDEDEFHWLVDSPPVLGNEARYTGLTLSPLASSSPSAPAATTAEQADISNDKSTPPSPFLVPTSTLR